MKKTLLDKDGLYTGLLRQVHIPLIIFVFFQLALTAGLGIMLVLRMSAKEAMRQTADQAQAAATIMEEYKAMPRLLDYWYEHQNDFEFVYDTSALDQMESEFRTLYPDHLFISELTIDEFDMMDDDTQDFYARLCHGRLSSEFDRLKTAFEPQWLFSFVVKGDMMSIMVTGVTGDEKRLSQGGDLFELGVTSQVDRYQYKELYKLVESSNRYSHDKYYSDVDPDLNSAASWIPVIHNQQVIAVVGSSQSYMDIYRDGLPSILGLGALIVLSFIYLELGIVYFLQRRVINPITSENKTIREYMDSKDVSTTVRKLAEIKTHNEIETLAISFSQMIEEIDRYVEDIRRITAQSERIGAELNVARQIQLNMLPRVFPPYPDRHEFELYASMDPAREVGGDFYDFFLKDDDHIVLVIGDVSGKGVPASLFMAISKVIVRNIADRSDSPDEILTSTNRVLCDGNEEAMFVTLWIALIEISTGRVISGNAGHEHPAIRRAACEYELDLYDHDTPMALFEDMQFCREREFVLHPGDSLFVYTDGIPEAVSTGEEFFGTDRMLEVLNRDPDADPQSVIEGMTDGLRDYTAGVEQFDDITMLCFKYLGAENKK